MVDTPSTSYSRTRGVFMGEIEGGNELSECRGYVSVVGSLDRKRSGKFVD